MGGGVLYLTNNRNTLGLYDWLVKKKVPITISSGRITKEQVEKRNPQLIVSYNYNYIIREDVIECMQGHIINLHISLLPWNRGASPNVWSFLDDTPKGVTIHLIDAGLDTGSILYQKECFFDIKKETFASSYNKLHREIVELFKQYWEEIYAGTFVAKKQLGAGSYHTIKDLDEIRKSIPFKWDEVIYEVVEKMKRRNRGC